MESAFLYLSLLLAGESVDAISSPRFVVRLDAERRLQSLGWIARPALLRAAESKDAHAAAVAGKLLARQDERLSVVRDHLYVFNLIWGTAGTENDYGYWIDADDARRLEGMPSTVCDTIERVGCLTLVLERNEVPAFRVYPDTCYRSSVVNVLRNRARFNYGLGCCEHTRKQLVRGRLLEQLPMPRECY